MTYQAIIHFDAVEDDYNEGELGDATNYWSETFTSDTLDDLRQTVLDATYQNSMSDLDDDQMNEYENWTEYHTSYLADEDNQGDASDEQVEQWRDGNLRLWAINCHVLVSELTEKKATL